jgi:hypothetical protein
MAGVGAVRTQLEATPEGLTLIVDGDVEERSGCRPALQEIQVTTTKRHHTARGSTVLQSLGELLQPRDHFANRVVAAKE